MPARFARDHGSSRGNAVNRHGRSIVYYGWSVMSRSTHPCPPSSGGTVRHHHQPARLVRRCVLGAVVAVTTLLLALVGAVTAVAGPRGVCPFCRYEVRVEEERERDEGCRGRVRAHWARLTGYADATPGHHADSTGRGEGAAPAEARPGHSAGTDLGNAVGTDSGDIEPRRRSPAPTHHTWGDPRVACERCAAWICSDWIPPVRWSYRSPGAPRRRNLCPERTGGSLPALVCS